ncbi:MAG: HAMP domain-containing histidine kinase [Deltaproteobacteria bacterium]|nr:HAMP domain-containing histidine kinase [Deltaproteobacteria bacterium]
MASESSTNPMSEISKTESEYGLGLLASTLAHEIRNPLQTIRLQIDAAHRGGSLQTALTKIAENITRLESVVDRVQKLSQRYVVHPEKINLRDFVDSVLSSVNFWLSSSGISVSTHIQWEGEPVCEGDKELLQQVLLNLVMNAVQAMPESGALSVQVYEELEHAVIEVQDSGVGIDKKSLKLVGTPFFTTKETGTGLGLAFCKTIAALHHGSLEIESQEGEGTKVYLRVRKNSESINEDSAKDTYHA